MKNPKIYVKIIKDAVIPMSYMNKELSNIFSNPNTIMDNIHNYNSYTQEFIKMNNKSDDIFWSDDYTWNAETHCFNFNNIYFCDDKDYEDIMNSTPVEFDPSISYGVNANELVNKTYISNIEVKYPCPDINSGFYFDNKRWKLLVRNIMKQKNTMLVGPTGAGKTDVVIRICRALNIPCHIYDMGSMQDPLTDLLGSHRLENGTSKFDYAKFVYDIQKPGVILLDELSRAPQMAANILFPCLDGRRTLPVEIADSSSDRIIKIHPECTFIATANIGNEYTGTTDIDEALLNRFMVIQVDYLPADIEKNILNVRTGIDGESALKIVNLANTLRTRFMNNELSKTISTRETLNCAELVCDGFSVIDAVNFSFCEKYMKTGENEYEIVKRIIMGF